MNILKYIRTTRKLHRLIKKKVGFFFSNYMNKDWKLSLYHRFWILQYISKKSLSWYAYMYVIQASGKTLWEGLLRIQGIQKDFCLGCLCHVANNYWLSTKLSTVLGTNGLVTSSPIHKVRIYTWSRWLNNYNELWRILWYQRIRQDGRIKWNITRSKGMK